MTSDYSNNEGLISETMYDMEEAVLEKRGRSIAEHAVLTACIAEIRKRVKAWPKAKRTLEDVRRRLCMFSDFNLADLDEAIGGAE